MLATGNSDDDEVQVQISVVSFHKTCDIDLEPQTCGCCEESDNNNSSSCHTPSCRYSLTLNSQIPIVSDGQTLNCTRTVSSNFTCNPDPIINFTVAQLVSM